jgi:iron(III) transport system substrate-binding protein
MLDKKYGDDFLRKIAAQNPKLANGGAPASQLIASGEVAVGFPVVPSVIPALKSAGAPIDTLVPIRQAVPSTTWPSPAPPLIPTRAGSS